MELRTPIFTKASTYSVLEKAVNNGKLSATDRVVYCFVDDTGKFYRIDTDKIIKPVVGDNVSQIERVNALPPISAASTTTLYILGNVVYTFDGEAFYPTYQDVTDAISTLSEEISSINNDVLDLKSDVSTLSEIVDLKADASDVYAKDEVDNLLNAKANSADVYSKSESNELLGTKADTDSVYTKNETDLLLNVKADSASVYTKTEVDDMMGGIVDPSGQEVTVQEYVDTAKADAISYTNDALALNIV